MLRSPTARPRPERSVTADAGDLPAWPSSSAPHAPDWGAWVRSRGSGLGLSVARTEEIVSLITRLAHAGEHAGPVLEALAAASWAGEARFPPALGSARGRLAAWIWALPLAAAGQPAPAAEAAAFGRLVALASGAGGLALARTPDDGGPDLGAPDARAVLVHAGVLGTIVTAGRVVGPIRVLQLRAALGSPTAQRRLEAAAQPVLDALPTDDPLVAAVVAGWTHALATLRFQALAALARPDPWRDGPPAAQLVADRAAAVDALLITPNAEASWEHQRWGLADDPTALVGHDYIRATVLRALAAAGHPGATDRLGALVAGLPAAPLRYYGPWPRLPPDADSLGLFLLCARETDAARPSQIDAWLSVVRPSLRPDGVLPTWLTEGPNGPTTPEPRWAWGGDDCGASRTVAVTGLLAWDATEWCDVAARNLDSILADPGSAPFYYDAAWAAALLQQLAARPELAALPAPLRARLRRRVRRDAEQAAETQGSDGGWGDPQTTAARLPLLRELPDQEVAVARGLRYLSEHQRPDGTWGASPFFLTIGKPPFPVHPHRGPELTTALCLLGIARTMSTPRS